MTKDQKNEVIELLKDKFSQYNNFYVANTESFGVGIRVIANGCWGFAATNNVTKEGMAKTAAKAVAVAKANAKIGGAPVELAAQKGYGEVSWKTPIEKNAFEVPIKEKVDLLLSANGAAMAGGANFVNSVMFAVNEQKYFASTDGSYIDQDVHRIYPSFTVTKIDPAAGSFSRDRRWARHVAAQGNYPTLPR